MLQHFYVPKNLYWWPVSLNEISKFTITLMKLELHFLEYILTSDTPYQPLYQLIICPNISFQQEKMSYSHFTCTCSSWTAAIQHCESYHHPPSFTNLEFIIKSTQLHSVIFTALFWLLYFSTGGTVAACLSMLKQFTDQHGQKGKHLTCLQKSGRQFYWGKTKTAIISCKIRLSCQSPQIGCSSTGGHSKLNFQVVRPLQSVQWGERERPRSLEIPNQTSAVTYIHHHCLNVGRCYIAMTFLQSGRRISLTEIYSKC